MRNMADQKSKQASANVNEKSRQLLDNLYGNIDRYDYERVSGLLTEFRILTREKTLGNDILDDRCMNLLVDCSRNNHPEAQKCLSNLILNYAHIRENLVELYLGCVQSRLTEILTATNEKEHDQTKGNNGTSQAASKVTKDKSTTCEILYYDLRIIFLLSALCSTSRSNIRDRLLDLILQITDHEADEFGPKNYLLIIESLKTLFNLTLDKCINTELAAQVIEKLFVIVGSDIDRSTDQDTGQKLDPTDQLLVNLIHLLTNMPEQIYLKLSDDDVNKVLGHLDEQLKTFTRSSFRDTILPVLNACANICRYKEDVRKRWFREIIGSTTDFDKRPEEYDTLRGRLVKLMTSVDVHIKEIAAEFLYALCGNDAEKFITYTGFGNSAAYLSTEGLLSQGSHQTRSSQIENRHISTDDDLACENLSEADKQYRQLRGKIDPITGKLEGPKRNPMDGMSEEQKEWHAHELTSAIAKLSKLGVVKPMVMDAGGEVSDLEPKSKSTQESAPSNDDLSD